MYQQTILMIDDSREDAKMVKRIIEKARWPLNFRWLEDAEKGLNELLEWSGSAGDLIFLDIKMPKLSGLEILAQLAQADKIRRLPEIIIFSSSDLISDKEMASMYSGVNYQVKPNGYLALKGLLNQIIPEKINTV